MLQAGHLFVPGCTGAREGDRTLALSLPLPTGQQVVPDPQLPGHLGTVHTWLVCSPAPRLNSALNFLGFGMNTPQASIGLIASVREKGGVDPLTM